MRSLFVILATCLLTSEIAACASHRPGGGPTLSTPITVTVTNTGDHDADIYASGSGGRYHLGFVPTGVTAKMYVPSYIVSSGRLRLFVRPVGGSRWWTPALQVGPGAHTVLQVSSPAQFSTFAVVDSAG
jgi:hypothetical protein